MYIVTFKDSWNSQPLVVHNPYTDGVKLVKGDINQGVNDIDSFDLEIDFSNPGYNKIRPFRTLVEVRNIKNNAIEFTGRMLNYSDSMAGDGVHTKMVVCEGALGYLHDVHPWYLEVSGSPENLFKVLINAYNEQVEDYKKLKLGVVDLGKVIDKNGNVISSPGYSSAGTGTFLTPEKSIFEHMKVELIDEFGGEVQVRHVGSLMYVDYVQSIGKASYEDIAISRNLRSVTKKVDPSEIVTRLIPLGKMITTEAENDNERRVVINSVNGDHMYIEKLDLKNEFGIQTGVQIFDDIEDPGLLKSAGMGWLMQQKVILQQFTVEALDLFKLGKGVDEYIVGNTHKLVNPIMNVNERIRVIAKKVDIVEPINSSLTIGDKIKTLLDYQKEQRKVNAGFATIKATVSQQKSSINSLSGKVSDVQTILSSSNVESLPADLQLVQQHLTKVEDSLEKIESDLAKIPTYSVVTQTKDGLMLATDKKKLDGMLTLKRVITTIGDGVAKDYVITHNLNSQDIIVSVRSTVAPYKTGVVDIEYTSVNAITVRATSPIPTTEKLSVTIIG